MKFNRVALAVVAAATALGGTASANAADLVTNGGFETPTTGSYGTFAAGTGSANGINGWTVTAGDVNTVSGTFPDGTGNRAHGGTQYLDLIGELNAPTTLSQSLATAVGQQYRLTFAYSNNAFGGPNSRSADVTLNGVLFTNVTHSTATSTNLNWNVFTGRFFASSTSTLLGFSEFDGAGNAGLLLDDVSVTAVPEPATWAMMIAGFGLVGGLARRRRRPVAFA